MSRWIPKERNYSKEKKGLPRIQIEESSHPLVDKPNVLGPLGKEPLSTSSKTLISDPLTKTSSGDPITKTSSGNFVDPLGLASKSTSSDPLTKAPSSPLTKTGSSNFVDPLSLASPKPITKVSENSAVEIKSPTQEPLRESNFVPWKAKKISILHEFTTNESIGITVSFIDTEASGKVRPPVDRTQQRLTELDQTPEDQVKETLQLTQKDYEKHIEKLHEDLIHEWNNGEKVKALKIAIQCAKLLTDVSVVKFYPSKFVLITEILDTFGKLVYERIGGKVDESKNLKYIPHEISPQARETCRNWFYKIASIRELLPRLYIEMAILSSYRFIQHTSFPAVINRILSQIRGIGSPLVSMYARTYLARKGYEVEPFLKDYLIKSFYDYLEVTQRYEKSKLENELKILHINYSEYLNLFSPALDWQLQCIGVNANQELLQEIFGKYKETKNPYILKHIISSFNPDLISLNAKLIISLIKEVEDTFPKYQLYTALGVNLVLSAPPKDQQLSILNEVWKVVTKLTDPKEYITVAEVYIEYPLKHCTSREVNVMLTDILKHMKENNAYEKFQGQLVSIMGKIASHFHDFALLFNMDSFLGLLDLFTGETQLEVNKSILAGFSKHQQLVTSDPIIINTMFSIGKNVHDSVNSLTFFDEIRQISKYLTAFINKIDFGIDLEKHLNFFVECRRAFGNLDAVKYRLVIGTCDLAMKTLKIVKGKHTKKTSAFIRGCISFCYITIPTVEDVLDRLNLYLLSGEVALANQALSQADTLFKSAIKLVQEVPSKSEIESQGMKSTEESLISFLRNFLSALIVVPGHPEQGPFYLVKGLLKVVSDYPWDPQNGAKIRLFINFLSLFSAYYQPSFPYHIAGVESNDQLYFRDEDYMNEIQSIINKIIDDILQELAKMKEDSNLEKVCAECSLEFLNNLLAFSEMNPKSATFAVQLYEVCKTHAPEAYKKNTLAYLQKMEGNVASLLYNKIQGKN